MKKVYLIPNAITAFGLTCGLFVIFKTTVSDSGRDLFTLLQASAILLLIAAVADLADGAVARWIKAESEFGGQFDSLSDTICFGVAPPLIVLKSLTSGVGGLSRFYTFFIVMAAMIYTLCGVLRLVRFNVQSKEVKASGDLERQKEEKKHFTGLPIPAAASAAVSAALVLLSPVANFPLSNETRTWIVSGVLVLIGYLMVSRWKFPSVKALHIRVPSFYLIFATGILAVLVLFGVLDYFAEAYFIISWVYLLVGWGLSITRRIAGKRAKALDDFEPDDDQEE